jgi:hypothetical protein
LLGVWNVTGFITEAKTSGSVQGITINSTTSGYGKDFNMTTTFSENPNIASAEGNYTSVTTTTIPGQQDLVKEIIVNSIDGLDQALWNLNGNTLTFINDEGLTTESEITEFTSNKLILKSIVSESQVIDGISVDIEAEVVITLEK